MLCAWHTGRLPVHAAATLLWVALAISLGGCGEASESDPVAALRAQAPSCAAGEPSCRVVAPSPAAITAYRWSPAESGALRAHNAAQSMSMVLRDGTMHLSGERAAQSWSASLSLSGLGRGDMLAPPAPPRRVGPARTTRVTLQRGSELQEWYDNDPRGLEQGFELASPPALGEPAEPVTIELGIAGAAQLSASTDHSRVVIALAGGMRLTCDGLRVNDATGRAIPSWFEVTDAAIRLRIDDGGARYPLSIDPIYSTEVHLQAGDPDPSDLFGASVSIDGSRVLVGAWGDDEGAATAGAAYVFARNGGLFLQESKLTANTALVGAQLAYSAALSGSSALLGAPGADSQGAGYVFVRSATTWSEQQKLTANDGTNGDRLGDAAALSGDTAVLGAPQDFVSGAQAGSAYVFVRNAASWAQQVKLVPADGDATDFFGIAVAVEGDVALIGAYRNEEAGYQAGSAYVFVRNATTWSEQQKLTASDALPSSDFGVAVSLSGDTALIGADRDDGGGSDLGAAYVFVRNATTWSEQQKLTASDGANFDNFGRAVALSGDDALVGAYRDDPSGSASGSAYVFVRSATSWAEQPKLTASDGAAGDEFGRAVALAATGGLVGAQRHDDGGSDAGAAYAFVGDVAEGGPCLDGAQCLSAHCIDGVCCETACGGGRLDDCVACSVAAGAAADGSCTPLNATPCEDDLYCTTTGTCQSGTCVGSGNPCQGPDEDDDCHESCSEQDMDCSAYDGDGAFCSDGIFCNGVDGCSAGACDTHPGDPCDGPDGDDDCSEVCNEAAGACSGADPDGSSCDDGDFCNGVDTCASGACAQHGGNPCDGPDGDEDCFETCDPTGQTCEGYDGDGVPCLGGVCSAQGCGREDGAACGDDEECASGNCVNGICCVSAACTPYRCGPGGACVASCATSADCADGYRCSSASTCTLDDGVVEDETSCGCRQVGVRRQAGRDSLGWLVWTLVLVPWRRRARRTTRRVATLKTNSPR